jgi:hypothetical protein
VDWDNDDKVSAVSIMGEDGVGCLSEINLSKLKNIHLYIVSEAHLHALSNYKRK